MIPPLPVELWEKILSMRGPLHFAHCVGVQPRLCAALRIQRILRQRFVSVNMLKREQSVKIFHAGAWRMGKIIRCEFAQGPPFIAVRLVFRKFTYVFLTEPYAKLRVL